MWVIRQKVATRIDQVYDAAAAACLQGMRDDYKNGKTGLSFLLQFSCWLNYGLGYDTFCRKVKSQKTKEGSLMSKCFEHTELWKENTVIVYLIKSFLIYK